MMMKFDMPIKRMLALDEAAVYCHIPKSKFPSICPVQPTRLHERLGLVWDIRLLDRWLDGNMGKEVTLTDQEIAEQLP